MYNTGQEMPRQKIVVLKQACKHPTCPHQVQKTFHLYSNNSGFSSAGVSIVNRWKRNSWSVIYLELPFTNLLPFDHTLSCLFQTYCHLITSEKNVIYLTVYRERCHNQLWLWLEEGCRKLMFGVRAMRCRYRNQRFCTHFFAFIVK